MLEMHFLVLIPVLFFLFSVGYFVFWIIGLLYLFSVTDSTTVATPFWVTHYSPLSFPLAFGAHNANPDNMVVVRIVLLPPLTH